MKVWQMSACALAAALAGCASAPKTLDDNMIVSGKRIGAVQLDMSLSELLALKGPPNRTTPLADTGATSYDWDGLTVAAHDRVYWITAHDPRYRTKDGVGVGSEQIAARGSLGEPECVVTEGDSTIYDYEEIYFSVDNATGKVRQVGVADETDRCK